MKSIHIFTRYPLGIALLFLCISSGRVSAQHTLPPLLAGVVKDSLTGRPVEGASVAVAGQRTAVKTDRQGQFRIGLPAGAGRLTVRHVAYAGTDYDLALYRPGTLVLYLSPVLNQVEEVLVSTGYQTLPKERATGSFEHLGPEQLEKRAHQSILEQLNGRVAGVLLESPVVSDNSTPKLNVRGRNTIFSNDQPLYVLDNMAYDGDITLINPNDIESITVLKDAAAASIWGARAGNGVIVITTKKGRAGQKTAVTLNSTWSMTPRPDLYNIRSISASDFIDFEMDMFDRGYYTPLESRPYPAAFTPVVETLMDLRDGRLDRQSAMDRIDGWRAVDVRDQAGGYLYRDKLWQQYTATLSGGADRIRYYLSAGYDDNRPEKVRNGNNRLSVRANNTYKVGERLDIGGNVSFAQRRIDNLYAPGITDFATYSLGSGKGLYPYAQFAGADGGYLPMAKDLRYTFKDAAEASGLVDWAFVPLTELLDNPSRYQVRTTDYVFNPSVTYRPLPGMSVQLNYQYQQTVKNDEVYRDRNSYDVRSLVNHYAQVGSGGTVAFPVPHGHILNRGEDGMRSQQFRGQVDYAGEFGGVHSISGLAGMEVRDNNAVGTSATIYGYDHRGLTSVPVDYITTFRYYDAATRGRIPDGVSLSENTTRFLSYYSNAAYSYRGRYTLSASARIDKSNMFGVKTNQRSVPLWSSGAMWHLHREAFYGLPWLPRLTLRATYGYNGNVSDAVGIATIRFSSANLTNAPQATIANPPNEQLRWEKNRNINIGVDFGFGDDVFNGSFEYFDKLNTDLLSRADIDPTTGLGDLSGRSTFLGNVATTSAHGLDMTLRSRNLRGAAVQWETTALFSVAKTRVERYFSQPTTASAYINAYATVTPMEGYPVFSVFSYQAAGLDPDTGLPQGYLEGEVSMDYGAIFNSGPETLRYHGPARAPYFGALSNTLSYRGMSLTVDLNYRFGSYFKRSTIAYSTLFNTWKGHADYALRWKEPGDEAHTTVPAFVYPLNSNAESFYLGSSTLVERADYIALQHVYMDYSLQARGLETIGAKSLRLRLYASNLGYLWRANSRGLDPFYDNNLRPGKTFTFGIHMHF